MNNEERVPNTTPKIIANEKLRILSPPRMKIQRSTIKVLSEVFIVRDKVVLSDSLNKSNLPRLG